MSKETSKWLNNYTLIGQASKRGKAWHYREDHQGTEPNHYDGFVPVADVERRLFFWEPVTAALRARAEILSDHGVTLIDIVDNTRQVIIRPDTSTVLGVFREGYQVHPYRETLLKLTQEAIGDGVGVGSAGLLSGGGVAWVQFEMEDTQNASGVEYRPFITASTSLDGTLATDWRAGSQLVVCDNTLSAALAQKTLRIKKKHTRNSLNEDTYLEIREALQLSITETNEAFKTQVDRLTAERVTDTEWDKFLTQHFGAVPEAEGRGRTISLNRNDRLNTLWYSDDRVSPWRNTAFGVVQAVNTFTHHMVTPKGGSRSDTNALRAVNGGVDKLDADTIESLNAVFKANRRKVLSFA